MLRKLRIKIVAILMAVSFLVMNLTFVAIMAIAYNSAFAPLEHELTYAVQHGPEGEVEYVIGRHEALSGEGNFARPGFLMPVAIVDVSADQCFISYNETFEHMDASLRARAVQAALASPHDSGVLSDYALAYVRATSALDTVVVALVDASGFIDTVQRTAVGAGGVLGCALLAIFALGIVLSRVITKPVQRAWDAQAEFVADASHELKTPLTVIIANADILLRHREDLNAEQSTWVTGIQGEARRMKGLVEDMLFLARSDEEPRGPQERPPEVDLSDLVRQACLAFDAVAFEARVQIVDAIEDGVSVRGDQTQLEQLVKSLIDNAIKYAGSPGTVTVRLERRKRGRPAISVNNTGTPIAPEELPRVFDRFWRGDQARSATAAGSYGLGLAIAQSVARSQGAHIAVSSSAEAGTTFTVAW